MANVHSSISSINLITSVAWRQKFILMANNSVFGPWPLANPWRQRFILISNNSYPGGKCSYRSDRQQIDLSILRSLRPKVHFDRQPSHPWRRNLIAAIARPATRPLEHWPLAAKAHYVDHALIIDRQTISQQIDP